MSYEYLEIETAYRKLKSYIYYDNTDIILRRKLVEFESNITKEGMFSIFGQGIPDPYRKKGESIFHTSVVESVEEKLEMVTDGINSYHENPEFIDYFLNNISIDLYPKKIFENETLDNYLTNKRVYDEYKLEKVTPFINAPIELHIVTVLWLIEFGVSIENSLSDYCYGNRLLLNKSKDKIVQGSSLFKPYFKQYQKWRDNAINASKNILNSSKDSLFLSLDIKNYFHSVRLDIESLRSNTQYKALQYRTNLQNIFAEIHARYTKKLAGEYSNTLSSDISGVFNDNGDPIQVVLPIGLLSSYLLANKYLDEFDKRIIHKIKPAYYGRYVDDIIIVIADPDEKYNDNEKNKEIKFEFGKYKRKLNRDKNSSTVSFKESDINILEKYVLENFYPVLELVDNPEKESDAERLIKLAGYTSLYCQPNKLFMYYFHEDESDIVIDKLKKDLEEKISEFRDFPDEEEDSKTFENDAYHLYYDGSEGKISTLKDYKENRYGLTVYLANKIFSALRNEDKVNNEESEQVLKFFRGLNCLSFYKLWEKIFTFFLVNNKPKYYVEFYLHCIEEIEKIRDQKEENRFYKKTRNTLLEYLDCAHEISNALNPTFINSARLVKRQFEFRLNQIESDILMTWLDFEPTRPESFWGMRFRKTNMVRHHYCIHPLLTYTQIAKKEPIDLTSLAIRIEDFSLDQQLLSFSPRPVKFWECCMAKAFEELNTYNQNSRVPKSGYIDVNIMSVNSSNNENGRINERIYLKNAINLYCEINQGHIPNYVLDEVENEKKFYNIYSNPANFDKSPPVIITELHISDTSPACLSPKIAFANTEVNKKNILDSIRGNPNISFERYRKLSNILQNASDQNIDILLFPEFFIPINLLSSVVRYSEKHSTLTITGLEHITLNHTSFNFVVTVLPFELDGISDAVVLFRLKNHYAHSEEAIIDANHKVVPKPVPYRYDIFNWRNIYFSPFYCFELANAYHRSLLKGKIDLLIGIEWNRDTPYFSNIVESVSRDLHAYIAQVNTSQYGDTRLTQPVETARKDILRLKGGTNDTILVGTIDIDKLRDFQRQKYSITHITGEFKPLPPDFQLHDVLNRIKNKPVL